jgi:hypothetical protein
MRRALLAFSICAGCRSGSVVQEPAPAVAPAVVTAPAGPPPAEPAPPPPASTVHGEDCTGTQDDLAACRAMGAACKLAALPAFPEPSPCRNRGARCLDHMKPKRDLTPQACHCTCGDRYQARRRAVDAEHARLYELEHRDDCEETIDLSTGEKVEICKEPRKPQ